MTHELRLKESFERALDAFGSTPDFRTRTDLEEVIDALIQDAVWKENDRIYRGLQKLITRMINESYLCPTEAEANIQVQVMERFEALLDNLYPFD